MSPSPRRHRLPMLLTLLGLCVGLLAVALPAPARARGDDPVGALERHAHPLRSTEPGGDLGDLHPLGEMVGDAVVVGMGEATHSSREFFTLKHRVFQYLVQEKGFSTFALETNWNAGLRLNRYVLEGEGDPRQIMDEEFGDFWQQPWNTQEYLDLVEWMRKYNTRHEHKVQFMAFDTYYPSPAVIDEVTGYVKQHHPELTQEITKLYQELRPTDLPTFMAKHWNTPLAQRQAQAKQAGRALEVLERQAPGDDPEAFAWAVQHARVLHQTATLWSFDFQDPAAAPAAMEYRDQVMADNTVWWQQHTGGRILASAHNGHIANETLEPAAYPTVQGTFLRRQLGDGYVSIGFTFDQGSFNALEGAGTSMDSVGQPPKEFTLGPAAPGSNEHTLDQVAYTDYLLDLRTAPAPARDWLRQARPTRDIGAGYPVEESSVALASAYDILVHLHEVGAAKLLT